MKLKLYRIMRPNTPHAVFTPDHSICHGGHFYATSTMQDTMFGIVNTFMSPDALTNTDHRPHGILLRRIAAFYHEILVKERVENDEYQLGHLPNLKSFEGVLDLLTFCNLMILANVLDPRTYQFAPGGTHKDHCLHDVNGIPAKERYEMTYARGRCWDIILWFFSKYEIFEKESGLGIDGHKQVAMRYLSDQGSAILEYKRRADKNIAEYGSPHTLKALTEQMKLCFMNFAEIPEVTTPPPGSLVSLAFPHPERYGVREMQGSIAFRCKPSLFNLISWLKGVFFLAREDLFYLGSTESDEIFFHHYRSA
jgi:hypothetical protein